MSFITKPLSSLADWVTSSPPHKCVYMLNEGSSQDEHILSVKGANLCEVARLGIPTPPAFILSTQASLSSSNRTKAFELSDNLVNDCTKAIYELERTTGKIFGSTFGSYPLILCVRAGAPFPQININVDEVAGTIHTIDEEFGMRGAPESLTLPGVHETILGIGMNDMVCEHLANATSARFALYVYANFMMGFGTSVMGVPATRYYKIMNDLVMSVGKKFSQLTAEELRVVVNLFKGVQLIPDNVWEQLNLAVKSIYSTWFHEKAIIFRNEVLGLLPDQGVAVIIQAMIFGESGTCFTRNPITGASVPMGEFWPSSGLMMSLAELQREDPDAVSQIKNIANIVEKQFRDAQDIEFVLEGGGRVYVLQSRPTRRTPRASVHIAYDMVNEGIITEREALSRIDPVRTLPYFSLQQLVSESSGGSHISSMKPDPLCRGIAGCPGAVVGILSFTPTDCISKSVEDNDVIYCTVDCDINDYQALKSCSAVVTLSGTLASDTAIICRNLGKPCITSASGLRIEVYNCNGWIPIALAPRATITSDTKYRLVSEKTGDILLPGEIVTLDGTNGELFKGALTTESVLQEECFQRILMWADRYRIMKIYTTIQENYMNEISFASSTASHFNADALGLISTQTMFTNTEDRLNLFRTLLLTHASETKELQQRKNTFIELIKQDFLSIFKASKNTNVMIELFNESITSLLPQSDRECATTATLSFKTVSDMKHLMNTYHDNNPLLSIRGVKTAALLPYLTEIQITAIFTACIDLLVQGCVVHPVITIPSVTNERELNRVISMIQQCVNQIIESRVALQPMDPTIMAHLSNTDFYSIAVVLDTPRACIRADTIARYTSHILFDTDKLTTYSYGLTHDSMTKLLPLYLRDHIYYADPFRSIDDMGVGHLIQTAIQKCHSINPMMTFGVTGSHTVDPRSIEWFSRIGVSSLHCTSAHVPMVKLCTAQTHIRATSSDKKSRHQSMFFNSLWSLLPMIPVYNMENMNI